jgi:hypothetical protein
VRLTVICEGRLFADHGRSAVGFELPGDEAQERRFTRPVRCDERGAFAERQAERHAFEERVAGVTEAQIGDLERM